MFSKGSTAVLVCSDCVMYSGLMMLAQPDMLEKTHLVRLSVQIKLTICLSNLRRINEEEPKKLIVSFPCRTLGLLQIENS